MKYECENAHLVGRLIHFFGPRGGPVASRGAAAAGRASRRTALTLPLFLSKMPATARDAFVMTVHAVEALTGLSKNELDDTVFAASACEALGVERVISGHNRFIENW